MITVNTLIKELQQLKKEGCGDLPCIYSIDDEGNGFKEVFYSPSKGFFNNCDFIRKNNGNINAVCIN